MQTRGVAVTHYVSGAHIYHPRIAASRNHPASFGAAACSAMYHNLHKEISLSYVSRVREKRATDMNKAQAYYLIWAATQPLYTSWSGSFSAFLQAPHGVRLAGYVLSLTS